MAKFAKPTVIAAGALIAAGVITAACEWPARAQGVHVAPSARSGRPAVVQPVTSLPPGAAPLRCYSAPATQDPQLDEMADVLKKIGQGRAADVYTGVSVEPTGACHLNLWATDADRAVREIVQPALRANPKLDWRATRVRTAPATDRELRAAMDRITTASIRGDLPFTVFDASGSCWPAN